MAYKLGQRAKKPIKTRVYWCAGFAAVFVAGGLMSIIAMTRLSKVLPIPGLSKTADVLLQGPGRRSPMGQVLGATTSGQSPKATKTSKQSPDSPLAQVNGSKKPNIAVSCSVGPARSFGDASSAQLRKLAEYEQVCAGAVSGASFFIGTPTTVAAAQGDAQWVASVLKEFAAKQVVPIIFMEPSSGGQTLNAKQYASGAYDAALDAFFATLKTQGVTDSMMGTWVPWPEGNIPVWTSVDPADFATNVTRTVQLQKKHFPSSKAAVLLESKSYPSATTWEGGAYVSLLPYVQSIPKGLLDSFGLQGFAWPPTAPGESPQLNPATYLRIDFAAAAAQSLGVTDIWFNTGVFAKSYVVSKTNPYTLSTTQRQQVLNGVVSQARKLRTQGYNVTTHIFAQDKGQTPEGIDWSFWKSGNVLFDPGTAVFKQFVHDLQDARVGLWIYDSAS